MLKVAVTLYAALAAVLVGLVLEAQAVEATLPSTAAELRYCAAAPMRDASGAIVRSQAVLSAFRRVHPCPVTGLLRGACPGWALDHVIPLDCGGCDAVSNLQWLPAALKSCAGTLCKDRWERKIYCAPFQRVTP